MSYKIFISPSSQESNKYKTGQTEEQVMNLIADSLIPNLILHGVTVMRNNTNNTFAGHITQSNSFTPDIHLAIHSNAMGRISTGTARGCEVYCYDPTNLTSRGTKLANIIYRRISAITPSSDRGVKSGKETMSEVKYTKAPAVLIEIAYHDNLEDANWIISHLSEISHELLLSILEFWGIPYINDHLEFESMKKALDQIKGIVKSF